MRPLKILVLTDYFYPDITGGVERVIYETGKRMAAWGHHVTVATLDSKAAPADETVDGIDVVRIPAYDLTNTLKLQSRVSLRMLPRVLRFIRTFQPDLVHAHNLFFFSGAFVAPWVRWLTRYPLVTTLHLGSTNDLGRLTSLVTRTHEYTTGQLLLRASDLLICVSQAVAAHARRLGVPERKLRVVPNGVDTERFCPSNGQCCALRPGSEVRITFVGRLIFNKGPQYFVDAIPKVLRHVPNARFDIVGDGVERPRLEQQVAELRVRERVTFHGALSDVSGILRESHICVRPSLLEGMPLTVLEAMACGVPVVATPVGGTPEVVRENVTGVLIPPRDTERLATALVHLASNPSLLMRMGTDARNLAVRDYSWDRVTSDTQAAYQELVSS